MSRAIKPDIKHTNMKSRITVEVDFDNNNSPILQILLNKNSDDLRDKMLAHFTEQVGGSSWLQIKWAEQQGGLPDDAQRIVIRPIKADQFKEQAEIMLEQHRLNSQK